MKHTRWRIVALAAIVAVVFVVAVMTLLFAAPPTHEVHTAGAIPLKPSFVETDITILKAIQPSQSIADIRCRVWQDGQRDWSHTVPCPDDIARKYFPSVTQAPNTLYLVWPGCDNRPVDGYNIEYLSSDRKLIIHCYWADRLVSLRGYKPPGFYIMPNVKLMIIPTDSIGPGTLQIFEDDRIELLLRDRTYEFPLATATIS